MNPDAVVVLLLMAFALGANGILIVFGSDKDGYSGDFGCGLLFSAGFLTLVGALVWASAHVVIR